MLQIGLIVLGCLALVIYWTLSLARCRAGSHGPFRVWAVGVMSLFAACVAVLLGLVFFFGMRVGRDIYVAALKLMGTKQGSLEAARMVGVVCGVAFLLVLIGAAIWIARHKEKGPGPPNR